MSRFLELEESVFEAWANRSITNAKRHSTQAGGSAVTWQPDSNVLLQLERFIREYDNRTFAQLALSGGFIGC